MVHARTRFKATGETVAATPPAQGGEEKTKAKRGGKLYATKRVHLKKSAEAKRQEGAAPPLTEAKARAEKRLSIVDFSDIFRSSPSARVELIRKGVSASDVKRLQRELDMSQQTFLASMKLPVATLNRKVSRRESLSAQESERIIGIAKLVGQVQEIVEQSGEPEGFNAARWLAVWLQQPVPALGGARPMDYMDTMEGQGMVSDILARMQSGTYS